MLREFAILLTLILDYSAAVQGKSCKVPNGNGGICMLVTKCDPLNELYTKRHKTKDEDTYIRQSVARCGSNGSKIWVCCPPKSQWSNMAFRPVAFSEKPVTVTQTATVLTPANNESNDRIMPSSHVQMSLNASTQIDPFQRVLAFLSQLEALGQTPTNCGNDTSSDRIVGGNVTRIHEYPWMALLEYKPRLFLCGGSLISKIHVLTAAHCLFKEPSKVRLSEHNVTTDPDYEELDGGGYDSVSVVIIDVDWTKRHEDHKYQTSVADIGIIKMKWAVEFGEFIKPICLPDMDYRKTDFTIDTRFIVAGWGSDNMRRHTDVKMAAYVPYAPSDSCRWTSIDTSFEEHCMCAGGEKGKDSCKGDSGGPLMYKNPSTAKFVVVGIVSSGPEVCGSANRPAVYTYVHNFINWVYNTMTSDINT